MTKIIDWHDMNLPFVWTEDKITWFDPSFDWLVFLSYWMTISLLCCDMSSNEMRICLLNPKSIALLIAIELILLLTQSLAQQISSNGIDLDQSLIINVKNGGEQVYQEVITANTTEDIISVDFYESDGSLITQFIDFKAVFKFKFNLFFIFTFPILLYWFLSQFFGQKFITFVALLRLPVRYLSLFRRRTVCRSIANLFVFFAFYCIFLVIFHENCYSIEN